MPATETPPTSQSNPAPHRPRKPLRRRRRGLSFGRLPVWAIALAVVAIGGVVAAALLLGKDDSKPNRLELGKPRVVSSGDLTSYARSGNRTVFWAGPPATGYKLELTEVRGARVFVRYLTSAAKAGD